jgi:manganese/iron transport system ATP-binding protein
MAGTELHDDSDARGLTVLTDDERPLVLYGKESGRREKSENIAPAKTDVE